MGRSNKGKGAENQQQQQQVDGANSEANASGNHMEEASGEHTDDTPLSETPTATDIMSAINQLSQNVDKRFDTLQNISCGPEANNGRYRGESDF